MSEDKSEVAAQSSGKSVGVGIIEHPLYGLGVSLTVTDINNNTSEVFLSPEEANNLSAKFSGVATLSFVLAQIATLVGGAGVDPTIIKP
jgi:hypothetical protein